MKSVFDAAAGAEIRERVARLQPAAERQWGTMNAAQAVAHCANALEAAVGDRNPPRLFVGRLIGGFVKRLVLRNEKPFGRNSPTDPSFVIADQRDLDVEKARLVALLDRLTGVPPAVTTQPHSFFGRLTTNEWGVLMYKHLDHHLRQFGV
jgi:hypothetical protein